MEGLWEGQCRVSHIIHNSSHSLLTRHSSFPLTWVYIKNVPYAKFSHLKLPNNQCVTNMWNAQHIESSNNLAGNVLQVYINSPHFHNILAWPKVEFGGLQQNGGAPFGNMRSVENVRALRGGHGNRGRGGFQGGGRNWRAQECQPQAAGRVIGEVEDNEPTPLGQRRDGPNLQVNTAPPTYDGTFEPFAAPRTGQIFQCVIDEQGNYVPVNQQNATNPIPHMSDREHFQRFNNQPYSMDNMRTPSRRGGFRGGMRGGFRGGRGGMHDGMAFSPQIVNVHHHYPQPSPIQTGLGITNSGNYQNDLRPAASHVTLNPQQPDRPKSAGGSSLQNAAGAAEFVPQAQANRTFAQAAASANFIPQSENELPIAYAMTLHHSDIPMMQGDRAVPSYSSFVDKQTDSSYPSFFKGADSMAGYDGRYERAVRQAQQMMPASKPPTEPRPPMMRNLGETSPTHLPKHMAEQNQKTATWVEQTPTHVVSSVVSDGNALPIETRATYYHLKAQKADIDVKLAGMDKDADEGGWYRVKAQQAEMEKRIKRFMQGKDGHADDDAARSLFKTAADDDTVPSLKVRAEDGRTLPSISRHGSPKEAYRGAKHARNGGQYGSIDARIQKDIDNIIAGPPESSKGDNVSPTDSVAAKDKTKASEGTNPYTGSDGSGGIRLEGWQFPAGFPGHE